MLTFNLTCHLALTWRDGFRRNDGVSDFCTNLLFLNIRYLMIS